MARKVKAAVESAAAEVKEEFLETKAEVKKRVLLKPIISMGIAFGVGVVFGFFLTTVV